MGKKPLNPKQTRFVAEYLIDSNATQAAIRAGYSEKTAKQIGSRLLTNVDVANAIAAGGSRIASRLEITAEKVLKDIENVRKLATAGGIYASAIRASELQGKSIGMFEDKLNVRFRNDPSTIGDAELAAIVAGGSGEGTTQTPRDKAGLH